MTGTGDVWDLPWPEVHVPALQEGTLGPWSLKRFPAVPLRGYFQPRLYIKDYYHLTKDGVSWMATAPIETEGQAPHVAAAHGHVVMMGAGLGVALYNLLQKPEVTHVTVVERDALLMDFLRTYAHMDGWKGMEKANIRITDACEYRPSERVDHLYVDIWQSPGLPQSLSDTQRIQDNVRADVVGWWGQELCFLQWLETMGSDPQCSVERYQEWARHIGLPLIARNDRAYMACIERLKRSDTYGSIRHHENRRSFAEQKA